MVGNLENLSEALTRRSNRMSSEARSLSEKIRSDQRIQSELRENGVAYVRDAGRDFVVRAKELPEASNRPEATESRQ